MLQMYDVGGMTKSNPSPSQLQLAGRPAAALLNACCASASVVSDFQRVSLKKKIVA